MLLLYKILVGSILHYASVCYSGMARTHFLKLERLQYRGLKIALGLMRFYSRGKMSVPVPRKDVCTNYRYLVTVFHKHVHHLKGTTA
jgi:hypothetical protein